MGSGEGTSAYTVAVMFNVGGPELLVIALVALIVLGPDKLPAFIRQAGQVLGELRRISSGFQADVRGALEAAEREAEQETMQGDPADIPAAIEHPDPESARAVAQAELEDLMASEASDAPSGGGDGHDISSDQNPDGPSDTSSDTSSAA